MPHRQRGGTEGPTRGRRGAARRCPAKSVFCGRHTFPIVTRCSTCSWDTVDGENIAPPNQLLHPAHLSRTYLRRRRASVRARALYPLPIPRFNVALVAGKAGLILFLFRRSPLPARRPPQGVAHECSPPILNAEGGRRPHSTFGERAPAGFVDEVVQYSFHQPLRSCQVESFPGAGSNCEPSMRDAFFRAPAFLLDRLAPPPSTRNAGADEGRDEGRTSRSVQEALG